VCYSDTIRAIAREIPGHLLLTETDNPGGLKWLKGVVGMPQDIQNVLDEIARLRNISSQRVAQTIHANFLRMIGADPWLKDLRNLLPPSRD
jgi:Tat protein secretion system quality control protein TatD with DNase activity